MKHLLTYILLLSALCLQAQDDVREFATARTTGGTEQACKGISLKDKFSFKATSSTGPLILKINTEVCSNASIATSIPSSQNYIVTITPLGQTKAVTYSNGTVTVNRQIEGDVDTRIDIQYFDGLGRPVQTVQRAITPAKADLVTYQEYDPFGREGRAWLPAVAAGNNGNYMTLANYKAKAMTTYNSTTYNTAADSVAHSRPVYEASPLNRILEQYGPGADWKSKGKAVKTAYMTNTTSGELVCKKFVVNGSGIATTLSKSGNYAANQLYVTKITDEDENVSYEFKDKLGQVVLTRQINGTAHDTYYVYDDFGNLSYVLPPVLSDMITADGSVAGASINTWGYYYKYDGRNRCIIKKIPGTEPIYYVYDKADRLIFTQDGEQRYKTPTAEWTFNIPDAFGRTVLSGICTNTVNHTADPLKSVVVKGTYNPSATTVAASYTITGVILTGTQILSANYYDNYKFCSLTGFSNTKLAYVANAAYGTRYGADAATVEHKGQLTGSAVAQMGGSSDMLYSVLYYDNRRNLIQSRSTNHLGGTEIENIAYNFTGQPVKKLHTHTKDAAGTGQQTELYTYAYDHAGRLKTTKHKLNSGTEVTLASNTYDELGRLKTNQKHTHANLKTTYGYNIRSWTKTITSPLYKQTLYYNETYGVHGVQYGGNISAIKWTTGSEAERSYAYQYDALSRLKHAGYNNTSSGGSFNTSYSYDKHGNIKTIVRCGNLTSGYGETDNLTMTYTGNQLINIEDSQGALALQGDDFKDYANVRHGTANANEYTYNKNGAMAKDLNKGITSISYNSLNLPMSMDINAPAAEARTTYTYSATGVKLRIKHTYSSSRMNNPVTSAGYKNIIGKDINAAAANLDKTLTIDYVSNKVYENNTLKRVLVDGGYIEGTTYYFFITDHLGSNRVVANASGTAIQNTHYYPFGTAFAESTGQEKQPYKYNGKELDLTHGLNLYDYSARYMDSPIGRFTSVDPQAEKYYSTSPYAYCLNNPLKYIDPRGDTVRVYTETENLGHSWISVGEGDDMVVYSFGPGATKKGQSDKGRIEGIADGFLTVMGGDEAKDYNSRKAKAQGGVQSVVISDISDADVIDVVNKFIENNTTLESKSEYGDKTTYKTNSMYKAPTNNCTTFVSDMLNSAGSEILSTSKSITNRSVGEVNTIKVKQTFVLPSTLQSWLKKK